MEEHGTPRPSTVDLGATCSWSHADVPCINFPFLATTDLCLVIHAVDRRTVMSFRIFHCLQLVFANFICWRATAAEAAQGVGFDQILLTTKVLITERDELELI